LYAGKVSSTPSSDTGNKEDNGEVLGVTKSNKQVCTCITELGQCYYIQQNIFDSLEALAAPKVSELLSELDVYLTIDVIHTSNALRWWYDMREIFPNLSRMTRDYLSIPGKLISVPVNRYIELTLILQPRQSTLKESLAEDGFFFPTSATASHPNLHAPFSVSVVGAPCPWSKTLMS
jgi:hypothetical protein